MDAAYISALFGLAGACIGGLTSFGQAAFVGIGAYATGWLTTVHGASSVCVLRNIRSLASV